MAAIRPPSFLSVLSRPSPPRPTSAIVSTKARTTTVYFDQDLNPEILAPEPHDTLLVASSTKTDTARCSTLSLVLRWTPEVPPDGRNAVVYDGTDTNFRGANGLAVPAYDIPATVGP